MAAGEAIEEGEKKKKRPFLHCEPERDPVHRLQSIHTTPLGKNINPDEIQQLITSPQSQCRVFPAPLELAIRQLLAARLVLTAQATRPSAPHRAPDAR